MDKKIFKQIAKSLDDNKLIKTCISLSEHFKQTKQYELQRVYELVFKLYLENYKTEILSISDSIGEIKFTGNFDIWIWVESILLIRCKILDDYKDTTNLNLTLTKIKVVENYEWDNELKTTINRNVRKRRIEEKSLLKYNELNSAIKNRDSKLELEIRKTHFTEFLFIYFLSDFKSKDIEKEIEENEKQLLQLYREI